MILDYPRSVAWYRLPRRHRRPDAGGDRTGSSCCANTGRMCRATRVYLILLLCTPDAPGLAMEDITAGTAATTPIRRSAEMSMTGARLGRGVVIAALSGVLISSAAAQGWTIPQPSPGLMPNPGARKGALHTALCRLPWDRPQGLGQGAAHAP